MVGGLKTILTFEGFRFQQFSANDTTKHLTVRSCAVDSGSLTDETEIIRQSMCGKFTFNGE